MTDTYGYDQQMLHEALQADCTAKQLTDTRLRTKSARLVGLACGLNGLISFTTGAICTVVALATHTTNGGSLFGILAAASATFSVPLVWWSNDTIRATNRDLIAIGCHFPLQTPFGDMADQLFDQRVPVKALRTPLRRIGDWLDRVNKTETPRYLNKRTPG